jgi:hypothetical protein
MNVNMRPLEALFMVRIHARKPPLLNSPGKQLPEWLGKQSIPAKKHTGEVADLEVKRVQPATKTLKKSNMLVRMEAHWYGPRKCYRVWVPARLSENGKRCRRFFSTKTEAEKFIFETKRNGSVELAELAVEEKHVLGVIRQSEKYEPGLRYLPVQEFFGHVASDPMGTLRQDVKRAIECV